MEKTNNPQKEEKTKEEIEREAFEETRKELTSLENIPSFSSSLVDIEALDQMISAHQLKYVENLIQVEEEKKLAEENIVDLLAYPEEIQKKAIEVAPKVKYDPDYFQRNKIDSELIKPIQIASVIETKKNEMQVKTWKVEYHQRLINRLREFRKEAEVRRQQIKTNRKDDRTFFQKLFNTKIVDDHGHEIK